MDGATPDDWGEIDRQEASRKNRAPGRPPVEETSRLYDSAALERRGKAVVGSKL
jgi:hypothetical protein